MLLSNAGSSVLPAEAIEVWGGKEKGKLKLLSKTNPTIPKGYDPPSVQPSKMNFKPAMVQYVRIVVHPLKKIPKWHYNQGKPSLALVSEVIMN